MKQRAVFTYLIGISLIVSSLFYIGHTAAQAGTFVPRDTVIITPVRHDAAFMFEPDSVAEWAGSYDGLVITERVTMQALVGSHGMGFAQMSTVGDAYFDAVHLPFIYGAPPAADSGRALVLCREMAWILFGTADVVGLPVEIMDTEYIVAGVVETAATSPVSTEGFAWIPYIESEAASILYVRPAQYNPLSARLDTERLLAHLDHQPDAFAVTDGNAYLHSIVLRGQLLLALCAPGFLIMAILWLIRLFRCTKSRAAYTAAGVLTVLAIAVAASFAWSITSIDLWLPTYVGEGLSGYSRLFFNTGLLVPRIYLPMHLAALFDLNFKATVAFGTGVLGLFVVGMTKFLTKNGKGKNTGDIA